jgi:uncharacterized membrane protein
MAQGTAQPVSALRQERFQFVDVFRGIAVLLMIEGHAMRALLDWRIRATFAYDIHELFHGLPAPMFIFAAGSALGLTWKHPLTDESAAKPPRKKWRRELRLLNVLIIAYALQLSDFSLVRTFFASTPERLVALLNFNVLQCIVLSVLLVRWLLSLEISQTSLLRILKVLILAIGLVTPLVWLAAPHLPMWIATVLSREYLSFFPLFPYAGFAFAGAAWGLQCNMAQHCGSEAQFLHNSILLGGVVFVGSTVLAGIPWPPLYAEFWWSSPWYLWLRIGVLVLMCAYLRRAELAATGRPGRLQSFLALLGRRSFYLYVAHLLVLYGSSFNPNWNLVHKLGTDLPFAEAAVATACLAALMIISAAVWDWMKLNRAAWANRLKWSLAAYLIAVFAIS